MAPPLETEVSFAVHTLLKHPRNIDRTPYFCRTFNHYGVTMFSKCWQVIKDDSRRTFEVCGQERNNNLFTNAIHGMQRAGMNVSYVTPPVTNKNSSKNTVIVAGYTKEEGLHDRLMKTYREITMGSIDEYD